MDRYGTLLIVDDDPDVLAAARLLLSPLFRQVLTREDPAAIDELMDRERIDVFLLDMNFAIGQNSGAEGLRWLDRVLERDPDAVVVLMTAFGDLNTAVEAMRKGAADFVLKPWQNDRLLATVKVASELRRSRTTVRALGRPAPAKHIIAESAAMRRVLDVVARVAPTDANVLIRGENGTGKELIAQELHRQSRRAGNALVTVDLGAVPENLFESELFGHVRGAYTDADSDRAGRFQAAHQGTLFLDEIGNLPPPLQTKLLRVLESREVVPLGSDQPVAVDVRLIAATNQPLDAMVADGSFREDLLYRINTIEVVVPPLRARPDDVRPLAEHFLVHYARRYRLPAKKLTEAAVARLRDYRWPGNVRELSHTIERALILSDGTTLDADDFELSTRRPGTDAESLNLEANERRLVARALETSDGNISRAADALGITRAALYRRIEKHGL